MKFTYKQYIIILTVITMIFYLIYPIDLNSFEYPVHLEQINGGDYGTYPIGVYLFYPSISMVIFYAFFLIPLLLIILSKQLKANELHVIYLYYLSQVPLAMVIIGYLKQTLFGVMLLIFLIVYEAKLKKELKAVLIGVFGMALVYLQPPDRFISALIYKLSSISQNLPHSSLPGLFLSIFAVLGTLLRGRYDYFLLICVMIVLGILETRIYTTLFLIELPFVVLFFDDVIETYKSRRVIEGIYP